MSKRFKNMVLMGMIASLVLIPASVTRAADLPETESQDEMRERVYEEVLTEEITNDEDVIKVALEQYQERMNQRSRMGSPELVEDDSLSITQVLDTYTDENGSVMEDIVTTGLLVLDENDNLVRGSSIKTGSAGLNEYSIYASMNVSVTADTSYNTVMFRWFDTKLTYGTSMTAASLIQASRYSPEPYWEYQDITKQINYPKANTYYNYTPNNMDMVYIGNIGCGRSCQSIINAGSKSVVLTYAVAHNTDFPAGEWTTEYH